MMVSRIAYGDESIRRTGVPESMYLLGAYIADDEQPDLADALSVYVRQAGKLHWRDHLPQTKLAVCRTINDYDASHLVVMASPLILDGGEERARQQALFCLAVHLENKFNVHALVLERRQRSQDNKDENTIDVARRSRVLTQEFRLTHRFGRDDKRLWVPDQVVGALGDYAAGQDTGWRMIADHVLVEKIDPRR